MGEEESGRVTVHVRNRGMHSQPYWFMWDRQILSLPIPSRWETLSLAFQQTARKYRGEYIRRST